MVDTTKIREGRSSAPQAISEIDILWITAGLGCDGDTIAMTAATQPSIEDVVLGSMPWIPKVRLHNPFLAMENGDDFLEHFRLSADGDLAPFILVVEGSIPDENNKQEGYRASFGTDKKTGQPSPTSSCPHRVGAGGARRMGEASGRSQLRWHGLWRRRQHLGWRDLCRQS